MKGLDTDTLIRPIDDTSKAVAQSLFKTPPKAQIESPEKVNCAYAQLQSTSLMFSHEKIAHALGVHVGTLKRWFDEQSVPGVYLHDLCRMIVEQAPQNLDQFYTKKEVAVSCINMMHSCLDRLGIDTHGYTFIEPSAGCGHFFELLPKDRRIGIDIDPAIKTAMTADYLSWKPAEGKYIVVGNPPFGLRGNLALRFINHSAEFADVVAFILPQLFESDGKGANSKRVIDYTLAMSEPLAPDSFIYPDNTEVDVNTIFQVWTKVGIDKIETPHQPTCDSYVKIYSLSNGGTPSSTRNKHMIGECDVYIPSTCYRGMKAYDSFDQLPNERGYGVVIKKNHKAIKALLMKHDWNKTSFASTNSAINMRQSLIKGVICEGGFCDD